MKILKYSILLILLFINSIILAQNNEIIVEINGDAILLDDFQKRFLKSLSEDKAIEDVTLDDIKDYLGLLIKFKLKIKDGRSRGLLYSNDIQEEINSFKKNLILSYYIDKKILNPYLEKLYERRKIEIRASHILVNLSQSASAEDSVKAYEKFYKILARINNGEEFEKVAVEMSDDPSVHTNKGDIYYFTGGRTVPEFEDAAYSMEVGEVNQYPVRTMFGLHLIKITDKRPRVEAIRAAHIFIKNDYDSTGKIKDSLKTANIVSIIIDKLNNGEDFAKLAKDYSDDMATASRGGEFGFISRGQLIPALDSVLFNMKAGEISRPIKTEGGWHILKVYEIRALEDSDSEKEELKNEVKRGYLYKNLLTNFYNNLKENYHFYINNNNVNIFISKLDTTIALSRHKLDSIFRKDELNLELAIYDGGSITIKKIIEIIKQNRDYSYYIPTKTNVTNIITEIASNDLVYLDAMADNIESDKGYKDIIESYEDGLIVFKIDQEELMSKVKVTESDIEEYYKQNKEKYKIIDDKGERYKSLEEVKPEINNTLINIKFKEIENQYIEQLKSKYDVRVYEEKLNKVFENLKTHNEEE
ncbi:MAG: peptidyl-prolyl cis-trans isomerase [Ignavibacteria bacterium]|nr:peptidyl-prolyl cis-trans isomerase [Ignavibacteria bacterium]